MPSFPSTLFTSANRVEGGYAFTSVCVCLSVCSQDNSKGYEWMFMKLAVNDHHQNISLEFDFGGTVYSAYLHQGPDQNNVSVLRGSVHEDFMI